MSHREWNRLVHALHGNGRWVWQSWKPVRKQAAEVKAATAAATEATAAATEAAKAATEASKVAQEMLRYMVERAAVLEHENAELKSDINDLRNIMQELWNDSGDGQENSSEYGSACSTSSNRWTRRYMAKAGKAEETEHFSEPENQKRK